MRRALWAGVLLAASIVAGGCSLARGVTLQGPGPDSSAVDAGELRDAAEDGGDEPVDAASDAGIDAVVVDAGHQTLDLFSGGTFARATEASYQTGSATDGVTPFLAWAEPGQRRVEDRGDGAGPMLLMEGQRTNFVVASRAVNTPAWSSGPGALMVDAGPGPDGLMTADRVTAASDAYGPYQFLVIGPGSFVGSVWSRAPSTGAAQRAQASLPVERGAFWELPSGASYTRSDFVSASTARVWNPWDGRGLYSGMSAGGLDYLADLHQVEQATFPSSAIRTDTTTATRAADSLSYDSSEYPASFSSIGFQMSLAPLASCAELVSGGLEMSVIGIDDGNRVRLVPDGGMCALELVGAGAICARVPLSFERHQVLTIRIALSAGEVGVAGASTGGGVVRGTPTSWPPARLSIGSSSSSAALFGRVGQYIESL